MEYRIVALLNTGERAMWEWRRGDRVEAVERAFHFTADTPEEALEALWVVGNRMGTDEQGLTWPSNRRSMCMGDLAVTIENDDTAGESVTLWACDMVGWAPLETYLKNRARLAAEVEDEISREGRAMAQGGLI